MFSATKNVACIEKNLLLRERFFSKLCVSGYLTNVGLTMSKLSHRATQMRIIEIGIPFSFYPIL